MMTKEELGAEFWLLTRTLLQDARLDSFLVDGYIDPRESARIAESLGVILRRLRTA